MKKKVIFIIIIVGLVLSGIGIGWTMKHPKQLPLNRIHNESARLRHQEQSKDNIENILSDLESFCFKRDRRFGDSVGWTLGISWTENDKAKWITLYDTGIEYEGYIYTTKYTEAYSEYWTQLLSLFEDTSEQLRTIGIYEKTNDEMIQECLENNMWIVLVEYHEMSDGTWQADDHTYQYRLEISGRLNNAEKDVSYVYLSNIENISFEQAWKASGLSSNMNDYFDEQDAKLVAMKTIEK